MSEATVQGFIALCDKPGRRRRADHTRLAAGRGHPSRRNTPACRALPIVDACREYRPAHPFSDACQAETQRAGCHRDCAAQYRCDPDGREASGRSACSHVACHVPVLRAWTALAEESDLWWAATCKALVLDMREATEQARAQSIHWFHPLAVVDWHARFLALLGEGDRTHPRATAPPAAIEDGSHTVPLAIC